MITDLLDEYTKKADELYEDLINIPDDIIHYIPEITDAWSINMHQKHLLSVEIFNFLAISDAIDTEVSKELQDLNVDEVEDFKDLLAWFNTIRQNLSNQIIEKEIENKKYKVKSSSHGIIELRVVDGIRALNNHVDVHREFISRNINEYGKSNSL